MHAEAAGWNAGLPNARPRGLRACMRMRLPALALALTPPWLSGLDIGGSMTIHAFGAYYGLAASLMLSHRAGGSAHPKNGAVYSSDITAMVGTVFLFIFWPSFNGALASGARGAASPPMH